MDTNYSDNNSRAEGTENNKDKKNEDIEKADKKNFPDFFFYGQKGRYHQVEFRKVFATLTNKSICEALARVYCRPAPFDHQSQLNILIDSKNSFQASVDTLKHTHTHTRWKH